MTASRTSFRRRAQIVAALLVFVLLWAASAAACHGAGYDPLVDPNETKLSFFVISTPTGPALSLDANATTAPSHVFSTSAEEGAMDVPQSWQGNFRSYGPIAFQGSLPGTYFLNLSKPIAGVVYVTSLSEKAANRDATYFRVELWQGETRVGGEDCMPAHNNKGWQPIWFRFRPEVRTLSPTLPIDLRITRIGGVSNFSIGTGASVPSRIDVRAHTSDPLAGTVFIEGGRMIVLPNGTSPGSAGATQEGGAPEAAAQGATLLGFALAGTGAIRSRRHRQTVALVLVLVATAAGGCTGKDSGYPLQDEDAAVQSRTENATLAAAGRGAIKGTVYDAVGFAVRGATLRLDGTDLFEKTTARGAFNFPSVAAGRYRLLVEEATYEPQRINVTVEVGVLLNVQVTLLKRSGGVAHTHPFPPDGKLQLWEFDLFPPTHAYNQDVRVPNPTGQPQRWTCVDPLGYYCEFVVPLNTALSEPAGGVSIPPGTGTLQVTLSFETLPGSHSDLALRVANPKALVDNVYVARSSEAPFNVQVYPDEADPGHQRYTTWSLVLRTPFMPFVTTGGPINVKEVTVPVSVATFPTGLGPQFQTAGPIHVKVVALEGVVPYEPAHRDFWDGRTKVTLVQAERLWPAAPQQSAASDYPTLGTYWSARSGVFVPPGTAQIRGTLRWSTVGDVDTGRWGLAFKTPESSLEQAVFQRADTANEGTQSVDFSIQVTGGQADQFYQSGSRWRFYPDDLVEPPETGATATDIGVKANGLRFWELTAVADRDPNYEG